MTDREKVIKAIELEIKHENTWECRKECPYYGKTDCNCFTQVLVDALELLKEQEPVKPVETWNTYLCGNCNRNVYHEERQGCLVLYEERYTYCPNCGRKVLWNE